MSGSIDESANDDAPQTEQQPEQSGGAAEGEQQQPGPEQQQQPGPEPEPEGGRLAPPDSVYVTGPVVVE